MTRGVGEARFARALDRYQDALENLVEYERRRGSPLMRTLEA
jgi:hypothetical protein